MQTSASSVNSKKNVHLVFQFRKASVYDFTDNNVSSHHEPGIPISSLRANVLALHDMKEEER